MRIIKMFGMAAVVTAAFMATVGVASATAETQLEKVVWCDDRGSQTCAANKDFPAGTKIIALATSTEFLTNLGNVSCAASELHMTNTGLLVHGDVTALAFGSCKLGAGTCAVTAENLEYLFKGELVTDAPNSKYEVRFTEKASNGVPQITIECGMFIDCTFTVEEVSIEARLAFTPEILKLLQEFSVKGLFCGETMIWHGAYNPKCGEKEGGESKNCWVKMEG